MDSAEEASVRVLVRFRPVNEREREEQAQTSSAQFECRIEGDTGTDICFCLLFILPHSFNLDMGFHVTYMYMLWLYRCGLAWFSIDY
jgi:hypothetical protein